MKISLLQKDVYILELDKSRTLRTENPKFYKLPYSNKYVHEHNFSVSWVGDAISKN